MRVIQLRELVADARFGEKMSLREFVQPRAYSVGEVFQTIAQPQMTSDEVILACWDWVTKNIRYSFTDHYKLRGAVSRDTQEFFEIPAEVLAWKRSDCDGMAILLASLIRNRLPASDVYVALGDLLSPHEIGGHAWVTVNRNGVDYLVESTIKRLPPQPWREANAMMKEYRPKVYFNDEEIWASSDHMDLLPQSQCNVHWMNDLWCGCGL